MSSARIKRKAKVLTQNARYYSWGLMGAIVILSIYLVVVAIYMISGGWSGALPAWSIFFAVIFGSAGGVLLLQLVNTYSNFNFLPEKTVKAANQVTEGKFKSLIQHSLDVITILDAKGIIQYMSPSSERVLGYQPDSLIGQSIFELIHTEDHALMGNALQQKTTFFFSFRMQHHDGSWLYFESSGTNMQQDATIKGIVLNSRDVSDRKREEELKKQKELAAIRFGLEKEKAEREKEIVEASKKQLEEAFTIIEHKNTEISDSINYAFRIQKAMLPEDTAIRTYLPNSFVYWRPKDIVSGDFYWFARVGNYSLLAAIDCTGHGVPGAFMTMIGNTLLNQVVKQQGHTMPDEILNNMHIAIRRALRQDEAGSTSRDGMDVSFSCLDHQNNRLYWAGANNPLILIRANEVYEYKADKYPIGGLQTEDQRIFTRVIVDLQPGDIYYVYSDGFQDQFGGDKGRKYMTKRFKEFLLQIHSMAMEEQPKVLDQEITQWIGTNYEQVDDILILGVRV